MVGCGISCGMSQFFVVFCPVGAEKETVDRSSGVQTIAIKGDGRQEFGSSDNSQKGDRRQEFWSSDNSHKRRQEAGVLEFRQ